MGTLELCRTFIFETTITNDAQLFIFVDSHVILLDFDEKYDFNRGLRRRSSGYVNLVPSKLRTRR